jgi:hypothetical protein
VGGDSHVVELKLAGNGQVIALGAARSIQDDSGLTVSGSDGPTTYVRSTDAEGRSIMRLVFVQKSPRAAAPVQASRAIAESVVVAEANLSITTNPSESSERAELNALTTALDASFREDSSSGLRPVESALIAESDHAGSRAQATTGATRQAVVRATIPQRADHSTNADVNRMMEHRGSADDDDSLVAALEVSELAAAVLHPQPKYLVLAMLIIGTFARTFTRIRRMSIARRLRRWGELSV